MRWEKLKFSDRFHFFRHSRRRARLLAAVLAARTDTRSSMRRENAREEVMAGRLIGVARAAYQYPLLIKQLLHAPMVQNPDQQIVIGISDGSHMPIFVTASAAWRTVSKMIGVRPGDAVGVMDWDSN